MTGKSSLIDILDYCLGRSECNVAEGVIRQYVSWFGVQIEKQGDALFVARRNPGLKRTTSPDIFLRRGRHDGPPRYSDLHKNTTQEALIRLITRFAGVAENEHRPLMGTRRPLQATIRHALLLCIQRQDEIASRDRLFHRQGEQFMPQTLKDTIPYFLGAVDEDHFFRQNELDDANRTLRELELSKDVMQRSTDNALRRVRNFVLDARRVGLIDENFESTDIKTCLVELKRAVSTDLRSPTVVTRSRDLIVRLENELHTLRGRLEEIQADIHSTRHFIREQTVYSREIGEQHARLLSLELYKAESDSDTTCPLCESHLSAPPPTVADLTTSLAILQSQLEAVTVESPHLQQRLDTLGKRRTELQDALVATQRDLEQAYANDERSRIQRDQVIERARVVGRIGAFLDQSEDGEESSDIERRISEAKRLVDALKKRVSPDDVRQRVLTFLNLISNHMTHYASNLELEHTEGRIRLDLDRLSVVADMPEGPIPLSRIGSGENWIGYHVVTLLSLHRWFRDQNRPVPGFVIFDQPSQAHYPPEADQTGSPDTLQDADRRAVHNLFRLLHSASEEIDDFQLIVLDHAHLEGKWFEDAIVEEWRSDKALVPIEWIHRS